MPVAIITGADSGIGRATAVALAERGFDVGITWHADQEGARQTAVAVDHAGRHAALAHLEMTTPDAPARAVDSLAAGLGGLDVLVNNAGTGSQAPSLELELDEWRRALDTDLTGAFLAAQQAARLMVAAGHGGRIINVTSVHEHVPLRGASTYCAAKGGLGLLTKVMALELAANQDSGD